MTDVVFQNDLLQPARSLSKFRTSQIIRIRMHTIDNMNVST